MPAPGIVSALYLIIILQCAKDICGILNPALRIKGVLTRMTEGNDRIFGCVRLLHHREEMGVSTNKWIIMTRSHPHFHMFASQIAPPLTGKQNSQQLVVSGRLPR